MNYKPIACRLYDELERIIIEKREVELVFHAGSKEADPTRNGEQATEPITLKTRISDVFTRDKQEFIRLPDGQEIRLDCLVRAGSHEFGNESC